MMAAESWDAAYSEEDLAKWEMMVDKVGLQRYQSLGDRREEFRRRVYRGIPQRYRWRVWKTLIGVDDFPMPSDYASRRLEENTWTAQISIDISRTFPEIPGFDGAQQQRLMNLLNAYAAFYPTVGYCQGMNFLAGLLLLISHNEEESFAAFVKLMNQMGLAGFYRDGFPMLHKYIVAADRLMDEFVPDVRQHFIKENVLPAVYLHEWFLTFVINSFPLSMVLIIWDVIVLEGPEVLLKVVITILFVLKDTILSMRFDEIVKFFKQMKGEYARDESGDRQPPWEIGQLLMKHTQKVELPEAVVQLLGSEAPFESDGLWEIDNASGSFSQRLMRISSTWLGSSPWHLGGASSTHHHTVQKAAG
eukprot:TRINITY_DN113154_c0_g1_i1.p1 TRINITY_DN113154_c0_g1~~TRINITY_DN113154_c0_g1_i1.p1  ORF type:complete len:361 (+),score=57.25 TRINITY_DN113154_c0_g1_i1:122-1204(+)